MTEDNPLLAGFKPRPAVHHQPVELAELWTMTKQARRARCVLVEHPVGIELRVIVDGQPIHPGASGSRPRTRRRG